MGYAQGPVPPQSQPSILPSKALLKTWLPKTRSTQWYQFPQKIHVRDLILVFLLLTQTDRSTNQEKSLSQWIFMAVEDSNVSLLPMIQTSWKREEWLQELGQSCLLFLPFLPSSSLYGTEQGLQGDTQWSRAWKKVKTSCFKSSICRYTVCVSVSTSWPWRNKRTQCEPGSWWPFLFSTILHSKQVQVWTSSFLNSLS